MPESVVREELEALDIHVQAVMQLRSGRRGQDPTKDRPLTPHFIVSVVRGPEVSKVDQSLNCAVCECRWSRTWLQRVPCNENAASASDTRSVTADTRPGRRVWWRPPHRWVLNPAGTASVLWMQGQPQSDLQGLY